MENQECDPGHKVSIHRPIAMPNPVGTATTSPNTLVERIIFHIEKSRRFLHCCEMDAVVSCRSGLSRLGKDLWSGFGFLGVKVIFMLFTWNAPVLLSLIG